MSNRNRCLIFFVALATVFSADFSQAVEDVYLSGNKGHFKLEQGKVYHWNWTGTKTAPELVVPALARTAKDSYAITEFAVGNLSVISDGMRYEVYHFGQNVRPAWVMLDDNGDFIVTERDTPALSRITAEGLRTEIFKFPHETHPHQAAIDEDGNLIVTNSTAALLYKVTSDGVGTVIYQFPLSARPLGVAIDSDGNYIVTEAGRREVLPRYPEPATLVKITPPGVRSVIFNFEPRTLPHYVAIDEFGNYIVAESYAKKLSRITPDGVRTEVFDFGNYDAEPIGVAIDSNGDYLVTMPGANKLFRITHGGDGYEIFNFVTGTSPIGVAVIPAPVTN